MLKNFFRGIISIFLLVLSNANLAFSGEETAPRPRPVIVSVDKCFPDSFEVSQQFGASFSDLCEKMNAVEIRNGSKICNDRNDLLMGIFTGSRARYFKKGSWACDSGLVYCIENVSDQRSKQRNPLSPTCYQGAGKVVNINDPTQNYGLNICFDSEGKVISIRADSVCDGKKVHYYQIPGRVTCTSVYDSTGQYQVAKEICDPDNIIPTLDHKHPIRQLIGLPENENPLVLYELKVPPRPSDCTSLGCSTKPEFEVPSLIGKGGNFTKYLSRGLACAGIAGEAYSFYDATCRGYNIIDKSLGNKYNGDPTIMHVMGAPCIAGGTLIAEGGISLCSIPFGWLWTDAEREAKMRKKAPNYINPWELYPFVKECYKNNVTTPKKQLKPGELPVFGGTYVRNNKYCKFFRDPISGGMVESCK